MLTLIDRQHVDRQPWNVGHSMAAAAASRFVFASQRTLGPSAFVSHFERDFRGLQRTGQCWPGFVTPPGGKQKIHRIFFSFVVLEAKPRSVDMIVLLFGDPVLRVKLMMVGNFNIISNRLLLRCVVNNIYGTCDLATPPPPPLQSLAGPGGSSAFHHTRHPKNSSGSTEDVLLLNGQANNRTISILRTVVERALSPRDDISIKRVRN